MPLPQQSCLYQKVLIKQLLTEERITKELTTEAPHWISNILHRFFFDKQLLSHQRRDQHSGISLFLFRAGVTDVAGWWALMWIHFNYPGDDFRFSLGCRKDLTENLAD